MASLHVLAISNGIVSLPEYIERNWGRIHIFGGIIYGKLSLFCPPPPPKELWGGKKKSWGGVCAPPPSPQGAPTTSLLSWTYLRERHRVTRCKTPRFQHTFFFSQKLSEIFQLCKVHVFAKLLGHILTFKIIIFYIWEFSYPNICSRKKDSESYPVFGAKRQPSRQPNSHIWKIISKKVEICLRSLTKT